MQAVRNRELERAPGFFIIRAKTVKLSRLIEKTALSPWLKKRLALCGERIAGENCDLRTYGNLSHIRRCIGASRYLIFAKPLGIIYGVVCAYKQRGLNLLQ